MEAPHAFLRQIHSLSAIVIFIAGTTAHAGEGLFSSGALTSDATSGVSTAKTYTALANVIGSNVVVNGATFTGSNSATSGTGWSLGGIPNAFGSGGNKTTSFAGQLIDNLFDGFQYNGNPGTITMSGLTDGQTYVTTLYCEAWSWPATADRRQTFTGSEGGGIVFNEDALEASMLRYTFVATSATMTLNAAPVGAGTFHVYGLSNEQVFNKSWSSGTDWTTATWSPAGAPNGVGTNANFAAQGAPTAINLNANRTVGHVRFDGANAWTLSGANTLTLQSDAGGVSVLSTPSGSHTISTPVVLGSNLMKSGAGTLTLSGALSGSQGVTVTGGALVLTGNSTYTGATIVNDGALVLAGALGNTTVTVNGPGSLIAQSERSIDRPITLNGGSISFLHNHVAVGPLTMNGGGLTTRDGVISGWESVFLTGDMTVGGSGASVIQAGGTTANRIHLADFGSGGSVIRTFDVADATGNGDADLIVSAALINGRGDGAAVGLTKVGTGTMTLTGYNTYTGGTTVNGGKLSLASTGGNCAIRDTLTVNADGTVVSEGDGTGLGLNAGQSVTALHINGGTVTSVGMMHIWATLTGGINMTGGTLQSNNGVSDQNGYQLEWGDVAVNTFASSNTATIAGRIRIRQETTSGLVFNVAEGAAATDLLISAAITDNGGANVIKTGPGMMAFTGANNYTGATTVNGGTLKLTNDWSLPLTSGVFINNSGTVLLSNHNTLGSAVIPRSVTIGSGGLLTMDGNFSVNLGPLTLNGGVLASSGYSSPGSGTYRLHNDVSVGTGTSTISALNVVSPAVRTFTVADGGTLNVTGTFSGIDGNLSVIKAGAGTMALYGANTYTGDTTVTGGSLALTGSSIADTNRLIIDGGTVHLTGIERVESLYFGATKQAPGIYSATGASGTIASANFTGTGTLAVGVSDYDFWSANPAFGLAPGQRAAAEDPDRDGMNNLLEYVLNGNPSASDPSIQPDPTATGTDFEFTYSRLDYSINDTVQTFEYGGNLKNWTTANIPEEPGVDIPVGPAKVTITDMGATDLVKVSVPRSLSVDGKLFGRLQVIEDPPHQVTDSGPSTTYTNAGKAYMGWHSTYAQQFSYGGMNWYLTEQFVKNQTDWMASNFKPYGYEWICLDGWGTATRYNVNGYIMSQADSWTGNWNDMAAYVHSKGMKFGIYFNPAWAHMHVANNLNNKIKGTNIPIKNITRDDKTGGNVYLIDTTRPGARQFVQGMVEYFISCGVDLLKVDFLREYEVAYGHAQTMTLLSWIREAAGNRLIVTLCMSIGVNHLQDERKYGDNIRVVGDYVEDLWYHNSKDTRGGASNAGWPMASNVYDGLSWSSDITGKGKFMASPDYVTYHNYASDDEKRFATSIRIVSGAAVEFGDSYSDISGDWNASFLRNSELTALNAEGFSAKPLTMNLSDPRNQIWAGVTANGDRIVALFNREDSPQTRSVNFQDDLGLGGWHNVRDLWAHQGVGYWPSYSTTVPAHGVAVIRIYVGTMPPPNGDPNPPPPLIGVPMTSGTYMIVNKGSGQALNIPGGATSGTQLIQWPWNLTLQNNDKWRITALGDGTFNLVHNSSNKCATVADASLSNGAAIVQWDYSGNAYDRWQIIDSGGGYYRFINQHSGKCLTVEGASTANGANILQWNYNGGDNDLWQIQFTP